MAWLQRRPQVSDPVNYYTVGLNKTILLVGLGNPGKDYDLTRHNVGYMCLDDFVAKTDEMQDWMHKKDLKCLISTGKLSDARIIAIKPTTFMNLSGEAVRLVVDFYKLSNNQIIILHDDLDVNFGQIRLRKGGSSGGHNGVKSIIKNLGEDQARIRVGIGPITDKMKSEDFVLQKFSTEEQSQLANLTREVNSILSEVIYGSEFPQDTRSFLV